MIKLMEKIKKDRIARIIAPICLLLICTIGVTIAFLVTNTDDVRNTFTPGGTGITIVEGFDGEVKSNVTIKNEDKEDAVDVYVRVMLVHNWYRTEADGTETSEVVAGKSDWTITDNNKVDGAAIFNEEYWTQGADGYYYYKYKVAPGDSTKNLINKIKLLSDTDGTHQGLEIIAEAIQADGKALGNVTGGTEGDAPVDIAWSSDKVTVRVNNDGTLSVVDKANN